MPLRAIFTLAVVLVCLDAAQAKDKPLLVNGDLRGWDGSTPKGWLLGQGAKSNDSGTWSRLAPLDGGGLQLVGTKDTGLWRLVSQAVDLVPGGYYRLDYEAGAQGRQVDPGQFGSCYVGMMFKDAQGKRLQFTFRDVMRRDLVRETQFVRVPQNTARSEVLIFLSMTGVLRVRDVKIRAVQPEESYDVLIQDMDRNYTFFEAHGINWKKLADEHRERAEKSAKDPEAFAIAIQPLLANLEDLHVSTEIPGGRRIPSMSWDVEKNVRYPTTALQLEELRQLGPNALAGRTKDGGFGFLAIASLQQSQPQFQAAEMALRSLRDAPGFVLDLRANGGGAEIRAQRLASYFTKELTLYGRSRWRNGPEHRHLTEGPRRYAVAHKDEAPYTKPVAVLIGPGCVSSGEGFAMIMKALPHAVLIGQPTRGASGNPMPVHLPNGVSVHYSRWMSLLPDGTSIERRGVQPDIVVEHKGTGDPTLDAAVAELKKRTTKR